MRVELIPAYFHKDSQTHPLFVRWNYVAAEQQWRGRPGSQRPMVRSFLDEQQREARGFGRWLGRSGNHCRKRSHLKPLQFFARVCHLLHWKCVHFKTLRDDRKVGFLNIITSLPLPEYAGQAAIFNFKWDNNTCPCRGGASVPQPIVTHNE